MAKRRADWRPPTDADWRRMRTLLRDVMIHLGHDAELLEQAGRDQRAERCRELAIWVEDEYRALEGGHRRQVPLDSRGMFPGTSAP